MAYTNAVFYVDHTAAGAGITDAARATLTGVVFSNPSGTVVRGHYHGHGLITGAVIDVTGCTQAYANTAWKVTYVGADDFDLDGALWASFTGADVTGNAVPRGGSSWTDAWRSIAGATSARIAAGDTIRIAKTPDPVSFGQQATWTIGVNKTAQTVSSSTDASPIQINRNGHGLVNGDIVLIYGHTTNYTANGVWTITYVNANAYTLDGSAGAGAGNGGMTGYMVPCVTRVVTLTNAVTTCIDDCEGGWAVDNTSTVTNQSAGKTGYSVKIVKASPTANTLYSHKVLPASLNLSGYDAITLWVYVGTAIAATTTWKVCLCSDTAATTIQDEFLLPIQSQLNTWIPLQITKNGGGTLYNGVRSVALYAGSTGVTTTGVWLDNIQACTAGGFALGDLISSNSLATGGTDGFYPIGGIYGKHLLIDGNYVYGGATSGAVTTYYRKQAYCIAAESISKSGSAGNLINYLGGYNIADSTQDGETYLNFLGINILALSGGTLSYYRISRMSVINAGPGRAGINCLHTSGVVEIDDINDLYGGSYGLNTAAGGTITIGTIRRANGCASGIILNGIFTVTAIGQVCGGQSGIIIGASASGTIPSITSASYHSQIGIEINSTTAEFSIETITKVSSNGIDGVRFVAARNCKIGTITEANSNLTYGIDFSTTTSNCEIDVITDCSYNGTYGIMNAELAGCNYIGSVVTSNSTTGGILANGEALLIGKATINEGTKVALGTVNNPLVGIEEWGGTAGRWYRRSPYVTISDQITGGQNAAWSYGGSGVCQYYNPSSTTISGFESFFVPCTAATGIQIHFQVKKTSAAADCLMWISVSGCGVTPIRRSSVTLTDSWAEYTTATVTPARTGFLRVQIEIRDGSTTGDIGVDDIHYLEV